ncbi:MAG: sulfotransferase family protein [Pseudonocardiaceae bacterium]
MELDRPAGELTPLFVCGSPRSGTTLMGHYLGTSRHVLHLGEYGGLFLSFRLAPGMWGADNLSQTPQSPCIRRYHDELKHHALDFPHKLSQSGEFRFWCDSTPMNLTILKDLEEHLPNALYVVMVRHYRGVLRSLSRAFDSGQLWGGRTWTERARKWAFFYDHVPQLPMDRTIAVSYDKLRTSPAETIGELQDGLRRFGVPPESLDTGAFARSWATDPAGQRPTIGRIDESGALRLCSHPDSGETESPLEDEDLILPIVHNTRMLLQERFPRIAEYV